MKINEEFKYLKYFYDEYYNQSYDDTLDDRFIDFKDLENDWWIQKLREDISKLEQVFIQKDTKQWNEIEALVHDDSLRYLPYSFGEEFIRTAKRHLF